MTLLASFAVAGGVVYFVHHTQNSERKVRITPQLEMICNKFVFQRMRQGVERDLERQQRKEENRRLLEEQLELQKKLEGRDKDSHHR